MLCSVFEGPEASAGEEGGKWPASELVWPVSWVELSGE